MEVGADVLLGCACQENFARVVFCDVSCVDVVADWDAGSGGDAHFFTHGREVFSVETTATILSNQKTIAVALPLDMMSNLMLQHFVESFERAKNASIQFDFILGNISKTKIAFRVHPLNFEVTHAPLFQSHADVLFDFGSGGKHGGEMLWFFCGIVKMFLRPMINEC